jgi:hypothetical protein
MVVRLSALDTGRLYPQEIHLVLILLLLLLLLLLYIIINIYIFLIMYCNCNVNVITVPIFVTLKSLQLFHYTYLLYSTAENKERLWAEGIPISADRFSQLPLYCEEKGEGTHKVPPFWFSSGHLCSSFIAGIVKRFDRSHVLGQPLPCRLPPEKSAVNTSNRC